MSDKVEQCAFERGQVWLNPDDEIMMVISTRPANGCHKVHYVTQDREQGSFYTSDKVIVDNITQLNTRPTQQPAEYYKALVEQMQAGCDGKCALDECVCEQPAVAERCKQLKTAEEIDQKDMDAQFKWRCRCGCEDFYVVCTQCRNGPPFLVKHVCKQCGADLNVQFYVAKHDPACVGDTFEDWLNTVDGTPAHGVIGDETIALCQLAYQAALSHKGLAEVDNEMLARGQTPRH